MILHEVCIKYNFDKRHDILKNDEDIDVVS